MDVCVCVCVCNSLWQVKNMICVLVISKRKTAKEQKDEGKSMSLLSLSLSLF